MTTNRYHIRRAGQSHHEVIGPDGLSIYETTRLALARSECRRLNRETDKARAALAKGQA